MAGGVKDIQPGISRELWKGNETPEAIIQ